MYQFKYLTVLFDPLIVFFEVQLLWFIVDLGAMVIKGYSIFPKAPVTQLARAVKNIDCISVEGNTYTPHNECLGYDIKPSDGEAPNN